MVSAGDIVMTSGNASSSQSTRHLATVCGLFSFVFHNVKGTVVLQSRNLLHFTESLRPGIKHLPRVRGIGARPSVLGLRGAYVVSISAWAHL